jgi:hypothetical protein
VPLDVLPLIPSQEFRDGPATLKFQSTRAGKDYLLELTYAIDGKEKLRVRQRWTEGDEAVVCRSQAILGLLCNAAHKRPSVAQPVMCPSAVCLRQLSCRTIPHDT